MSSQHLETEATSNTRDLHRALASLQEELEAVDYYAQRMDAAQDPELKALLNHNREEEVEHAVMLFEWLRRRIPAFDEQMKKYLFTKGPIAALESAAKDVAPAAASSGDLGIGKPKA